MWMIFTGLSDFLISFVSGMMGFILILLSLSLSGIFSIQEKADKIYVTIL
jgi:hypothetical protein